MGHEQDEFADFYRASRDSCLRAVTAVVGDRELAEEQVAEAFTRAARGPGPARHTGPGTVGTFCRSTPGAPVSFGQVVQPSTLPDGTDVMVINGAAMPPGTRLSIGYFAGHVRLLLIQDGVPLSCSSTFGQPAVHITPSGTPIRG
jgi:hypothetical protein